MSEQRQKNQEQLAFRFDWGSEAPVAETEGIEARMVKREPKTRLETSDGWRKYVSERTGEKRCNESEPTKGALASTG